MSHWVVVAWSGKERVEAANFNGIKVEAVKDALIVDVGRRITLVIFNGYLFVDISHRMLEIYVKEARPQDGIFFYVNDGEKNYYGMSIYGWKEERWVGLEKETCNEFKKFISWLAEVHRQLRSIDIDCENLIQ